MQMTASMAEPSDKVMFACDNDRWRAVVDRDRRADGAFYFSVETTGIYCRPSCAARRPNRGNVRFHETCEAAELAGYRACKRCRPDERDRWTQIVEEACASLSSADSQPTLSMLAARAGLSPFHFHRVFKSVTGITPKAYGDAARAKRMRESLSAANTVTAAIYDAGYNSSGRFYEASSGILGMSPTRFRGGGQGETLRYATGRCDLGHVLVAATEKGIAAIELGDDPEDLARGLRERFPRADLIAGDEDFQLRLSEVIAFIEQPGRGLDLPLDMRGTAFQHRVWQALRDIPLGHTASYSEIAARIGAPSSSRAVALACAANPVAVVIPCHRVTRKDGAISGYRWGVARKRALLDREAREA